MRFAAPLAIVALAALHPSLAVAAEPARPAEFQLPKVAGWTRTAPQHYAEPGAGYSVNYLSARYGKVTVYVYDLGYQRLPSGARSDEALDELDASEDEILAAADAGHYRRVQRMGERVVRLQKQDEGPEARLVVYKLETADGRQLLSLLYLAVSRGHFVKIRVSQPWDGNFTAARPVGQLLEELDAALNRG